ncbi:Rpn family recombination-promoting nuclease/putative transposase, partial [Escherichia coli]|uniref:Rpn family recombination-promoting nuclease/putative transposase n=1 Tax=Escherichia coli TaxID=562 RepID=UPI002078BE54
NARNGGKNSLNRLIRCVCGKKIGPDPRNFNQRVSLGRNDLLIRTFPSRSQLVAMQNYMLQRGHTEQADLFYGVLRDKETGGESMMTLAQWFEEKGIEKGIQQGRQEVSQEFAQRLLSKGMSREDVAEMANLPLAEIDKVINLI